MNDRAIGENKKFAQMRKPPDGVAFVDLRGSDRSIPSIAGLGKIETLRLSDATATQGDILTQIKRLRPIDLSHSSVTDEQLNVVGQIPSLMSLRLDGTKGTTSGLQHLVGSEKLRFLV